MASITCCGFPGHSRKVPSVRNIIFGIFAVASYLSSANEDVLSILIEQQYFTQVHGDGLMSDDYDSGGSAAAQFIPIVQTPTIRSWIPAGVIIQGPNPTDDSSQSIQGFTMIKARPVQYTLADGHLDVARWQMNNLHRR